MAQYGFSPKTISFDIGDVYSVLYGVSFKERRKPKKVIINDPATVVFFSDDSKVVTKAKHGDEYDPLFGIMACALRKVGRNRVNIDSWEPVIGFLADYLADAKECRLVADMLNATADALELDGVMDDIAEYDARNTEPEQVGTVSDRISEMSRIIGEDIKRLDQRLNEYERTRQTIRNLVDRGEL
jgi:urease gamma subunit